MKATTKAYRLRTAAIAAGCAALLAGGAGVAAAVPAGSPGITVASASVQKPQPKASLTIKASAKSVKAGQDVTLTGRTKGLPIGSKLVVQHMNKGKWTTLHSSTTVKHGSSYNVKVKLAKKGTEKLRVAHDKTVSPTVTVMVH
ncbi:hypothetical protein [Streptomyces sp. NPDC002537]